MPNPTNARGAPSRRGLLQGATACALPLPLPGGETDPALVIARQWCALEAEQRRLVVAWQEMETWLFKHRNWPRLSDAERDAMPEAARMREIDDRLAGIDRTYDTLLPHLKRTAATTRAGLLARFNALLSLLDCTDHPDARALLISCQRDLKRLWA